MIDQSKFNRLAAAQAHETEGAHTPIEIVTFNQTSDGLIEMSTFNWSGQMSAQSHKYLYLADVNNREIAILNRKQIEELIALLTRAQEIMEGGK